MTVSRTTGYLFRLAGEDDVPGARSVMLDTFYQVFDIGYRPEHHADVIDPRTAYLRHPHNRLWVAEHEGRIVATTAIRAQGPRHPPHPRWLAEEYPDPRTAQLFRVYVRPEHQRRGLAGRLVTAAIDYVTESPDFDRLYLHTDARTQGALEFWLTQGHIIHDARDSGPGFQTVHLEIPLRERATR
ncbi:GNAT family N-acetyltransferase [Nocardia jinanensis]|uniref:N-acetyltransferase n=1 Tax=Nocardia jinanensis TaxID=382504 RepID=A0A917R612_9NOCA|nr:GNAT family N-acetyltransferase [Nocardia jinanensis]GGK90496.1 N-acetyltransferase [Nocardia jinanensis]